MKKEARQFSLRKLILTITLIAIALVPLAAGMNTWRRQQRAISRLERHGVLIGYADHQAKLQGLQTTRTRPAVESALGRLGFRVIQPVDFVCAVDYRAGSAALSPVLELPHVETVAYVNSMLTDEIVHLLCQLPRLKMLNLSDTNLGDEALMEFAQIATLDYISIMGTSVTPEAVLDFKRARPDCTISSDLDSRFLTCLQRLLEIRASKTE